MAGSFALGDDDNDKLDYKKSPSSNANKIYFVVVNLICHRPLVRTGPKGSFTPSDSVSNVTLTGKMGMQTILPLTVPIKKIKGAAGQCYSDDDGVGRCEQDLKIIVTARQHDIVFHEGIPL